MNIIINTSTIVIGGGVQVSKSFLEELKGIEADNTYHVFLSLKLEGEISSVVFPDNFKFYKIPKSPSKLSTRRVVLKKLRELENKIVPDIVFTIFGPSYWKPKALHLCGYADAAGYKPDSIAFKQLNFLENIRTKLLVRYKNYFIKKTATFLVVETELAKKNISKYLTYPTSKIFVVGNTYSKIYNEYKTEPKFKDKKNFTFLTLSSYYKHKNLLIINKVSEILNSEYNLNVKFILTIKKEEYLKNFGQNKNIINLGPQLVENCPKLYNQADAMFLPTLLETFSASYPEAMKMERPILTSDLDFAHDICGEAALYFNPLDSYDIASKIKTIITDPIIYQDLVEKGRNRLKNFETSESRAKKYLLCCEKIIESNREK
ncbi:glycosyltransferase [Arenibacter sp. F20364]|uniref:glycosyltransferase n=1 Tax=Arenibacter sp. F20364 TaxID=2926415 RepID=UPI001FF6EEF6|nr:glycosyltransferase [Arenibacter sp. F20364]MCK0192657.1 glycosyltransferase [Arenibacter sp. F20364]